MKQIISKIFFIVLILFASCILFNIEAFAANMGLNISKTSGYIGDTFTVTISGINGKVNIKGNSNISLNISGTQWIDGSLTITGTAKAVGTGTVTVTPIDVTTTSAEPEEVTASASRNITIKEKLAEVPPQENTTQTTDKTNTNTTTNNTNNSSDKNNSSSKKNTTTTNNKNTNTTKKEESAKTTENEYKENQGTISEFGITSLYVQAINANNETTEIELSPKFDINTSEYVCNVKNDITKIEVLYEANEYKDLVKIEGLENDLIPGENIITIKMNDNNGKEKIYKIVVNKEEPVLSAELFESEDIFFKAEPAPEYDTITMPIILFIILQVGIIIINILISILIYKAKKKKWINNPFS